MFMSMNTHIHKKYHNLAVYTGRFLSVKFHQQLIQTNVLISNYTSSLRRCRPFSRLEMLSFSSAERHMLGRQKHRENDRVPPMQPYGAENFSQYTQPNIAE